MKVNVTKQPKAMLQLDITVEKDKVKEMHDILFKQVVDNAEIKGFRKGQAPVEMVRENTDISKLYGEVINKLLQTYYPQALKENHITPIANPRVEIKDFDLEKDFEFSATVAIRPETKVGKYKEKLEEIKKEREAELKKQNAERLKNGEPLATDHVHLTPDDAINAILAVTDVEVADMVIDDEADRLMARLVNQAQAIGLSLEQYLKAQNKTIEQLRNDYRTIADKNLKSEFALTKLVEDFKVDVTQTEIEDMIKASGDPKLEQELRDPVQKMYIQSILAKNKVINEIIKQVEGEHNHE